jgi:general secretion pathway protein E
VDIGVEPFLISSSVIAVVAQRLVRTLCSECKEAFVPDDTALEHMGLNADHIGKHTVYQAKGCDPCLHTGYKGRIGLFEIMLLTPELKSLILQTFDSNQIKNEAMKHRMVTLRHDGIQKVLEGITTFEEVLRVTEK